MADALLQAYPAIKAAHIIFVVAWMAGMMYLPRLFIYHHQSAPGGEAEKAFVVMERRLLNGIMTPSMVLVWTFAAIMLVLNRPLFLEGWFHIKLLAVLGVSGLHGFYSTAQKKFERGERPCSERFWRLMNEIPFVLMIVAVVMAVTKPF
jgi:putative membrane protein